MAPQSPRDNRAGQPPHRPPVRHSDPRPRELAGHLRAGDLVAGHRLLPGPQSRGDRDRGLAAQPGGGAPLLRVDPPPRAGARADGAPHGIEIRSITLFIFGGVARLGHDPADGRTEVKVARGPAGEHRAGRGLLRLRPPAFPRRGRRIGGALPGLHQPGHRGSSTWCRRSRWTEVVSCAVCSGRSRARERPRAWRPRPDWSSPTSWWRAAC